jgi:hypothetical protein
MQGRIQRGTNDWMAAERTTCCASEDKVAAEVPWKIVSRLQLPRCRCESYVFKTKCWEVRDAQKVLTDWLAEAGLGPEKLLKYYHDALRRDTMDTTRLALIC